MLNSISPSSLNHHILKNAFSVLCLTAIFYVCLFQYTFSYNYMVEINMHYFIFLSSLICFLVFICIHFLTEKVFSFHIVDLLVIAFLIYSFVCISFNSTLLNLSNEYFICCIIMAMIYFIIRLSSLFIIQYFIHFLITVFFLYELYTGIRQLFFNLNTKNNLSLLITGSLQNSGVYSYYLIISFPLYLYSVKSLPCNPVIKKICSVIMLLLIVVILYVTKSRTAMIAFSVVIVSFSGFTYRDGVKKIIRFVRYNRIFFGSVLILLVSCIVYLLIKMKPDSFYGRFFIWNVTLRNISNHFFTGIGVGNFAFYYPQWQIQYFSSHPNPPAIYFLNADETHVAFNEFLEILAETGIIGFLLFTAILIYALKVKPENNKVFVLSIRTTLLLILFACLTSYPLQCNAILFLFVACSATLLSFQKLKPYKFDIRKSYQFIALIFFTSLLVFSSFKSMKQCIYISKWNALRENLFLKPAQIKSGYLELYPFLKMNGKFLLDMGEQFDNISETTSSIKLLEESKHFYFSYRTLLSLANAYYHAADLPNAIKNLEELSNMIPSKFYPKYELAKLYFKSGDSRKGMAMAKFILSMPVKKMSPEISRIKQEIIQIVNENDINN